ncbi:MAG: DUF3256 family protein [Bacteroidales bacterium]|nr:DUF3256 family protein [Bacteroidales bacterium]
MTRPILLLAVAATCMTATARTAGEIFASAPDRVIKMLPQSTRLDMLDYYHYGSDKASMNAFGGDARVLSESTSDLHWQTSDRANMQLAVLTAGKDTVVAVVETLLTPVPDSRIEFYDSDWHAVKAPVKMPVRADWLTDEGRRHADELEVVLPFDFVEARFDLDEGRLILTNNARSYLTADEYERIEPWIRPQLVYSISGTGIKAVK